MENIQETILDIKRKIYKTNLELNTAQQNLYCNSTFLDRCDLTREPIVEKIRNIEAFDSYDTITERLLYERQDIDENLKLTKKNIKGFDNGEFRIDEKHELKDIATRFVYECIIKSDKIFDILSLIQKTWDESVDSYIVNFNFKNDISISKDDVKLLYRGGNTLSSILEDMLKNTSPLILKQTKNTFQNVMSKSDIDFTLLINPSLNKNISQQIFDDLSLLTLGIIYRSRLAILTKNASVLNTITSENLEKLLNNLNSANSVADLQSNMSPYKNFKFVRIVYDNIYYESENLDNIPFNHTLSKYNIGVFNNEAGSNHVDFQILPFKQTSVIQNLNCYFFDNDYIDRSGTMSMFITYNKDNRYKSDKLLQRYSLARLKINFKAFYIYEGKLNVMHLPGEFLDFGLTNNDVSDNNTVVMKNTEKDLIEKWENIINYSFSHDEKTIKMYSFSLKYYFIDICNMLFMVARTPWENKKYLKLLKRAFLLCHIDLLSYTQENGIIKTNTGDVKITTFMKGIDNFTNYEEKISYISSINKLLFYKQLFELINDVNINFKNNQELEQFNSNINKMFSLNLIIIFSVFDVSNVTKKVIDISQRTIDI